MLQRVCVVALIAMVACVCSVQAEEAATETAAVEKAVCSACPITAAMGKLPQMAFLVGEEQCHCPKKAASLAEKSNTPIRFAVLDETFDSEADAKLALIEATEEFVANFGEPHVCSVSGSTTIAGETTQCSKTAAKMASLVKDAMKQVHLSYKVGDEVCHCPNKAASLASQSGEKKLFVVGEECTGCEMTARLNLARAKYRAAVEALLEAQQQASTEKEAEVTES